MKRTESTNDKILRLFNEGWEAEQIAEEVTIPVGSVHSILERRIEGYAELLQKKSLEANKARTAAKEEALRKEKEAQDALEAKQAKYSNAKKKTAPAVNPDDFFNSDIDGMLVGDYKQKSSEGEEQKPNILTAEENRNLLTADYVEPVKEEEPAPKPKSAPKPASKPAPASAPVVEATPAPAVNIPSPQESASQKIALFAQAQIDENDGKIKLIESEIAKVAKEIAENEKSAKDVDGQIEKLDSDIQRFIKQVEVLKAQIAELEEKKKEISANSASSANIASLNQKIAVFNEQITALKAENEQFRALIK